MPPNNDLKRRLITKEPEPTLNPDVSDTSTQTSRANRIAASHNELSVATSSRTHRILLRMVIIVALMILVYFYGLNRRNKETKFALVRENLALRMQKFECDSKYEMELKTNYPECAPKKCGRFVSDQLVDAMESELLLDLAKNIINKGGSSGGASILDIHTGALSYGEKFLNIFSIPKLQEEFRDEHLQVYKLIKGKIQQAIAEQFGISIKSLHLTYPTFFSRMVNATPKTIHDEYWHEHIDKETYPSFHYTSLLYLNTYKKDFTGGRFIFVNGVGENRTTSAIEPKVGRVLAFTSGADNPHHVEKITSGERYAITISFTCDKKLAIGNPKIPPQSQKS